MGGRCGASAEQSGCSSVWIGLDVEKVVVPRVPEDARFSSCMRAVCSDKEEVSERLVSVHASTCWTTVHSLSHSSSTVHASNIYLSSSNPVLNSNHSLLHLPHSSNQSLLCLTQRSRRCPLLLLLLLLLTQRRAVQYNATLQCNTHLRHVAAD